MLYNYLLYYQKKSFFTPIRIENSCKYVTHILEKFRCRLLFFWQVWVIFWFKFLFFNITKDFRLMWQEFRLKNQMTVPVTYLDVPKHSFQILWATAESNVIKNIFVHAFNIGIFVSILFLRFLHLYLEIDTTLSFC